MAIANNLLLTYILGTGKELEEYCRNYHDKHGYQLDFDLEVNLEGILLGPVSFFAFPPLGILIEADFFYRIGQTILTQKYYGKESPGLIGKVREIYQKIKA